MNAAVFLACAKMYAIAAVSLNTYLVFGWFGCNIILTIGDRLLCSSHCQIIVRGAPRSTRVDVL